MQSKELSSAFIEEEFPITETPVTFEGIFFRLAVLEEIKELLGSVEVNLRLHSHSACSISISSVSLAALPEGPGMEETSNPTLW